MNPLKKRALAQEMQFARQEELQFKAQVLCGRMIGRWAGYKIGVDDVESYAHNIAMSQVVEPHRLLDMIKQDFCTANVEVSDAELSTRLHDFLDQATMRIHQEG